MIDQARDLFASARQRRLESRRSGGARQLAADRHVARFEVERRLDDNLGEVNRVPRLEPRRLPDSALNAIPVLLAHQRLAEASAVAIVRDPRVDAEHERGFAVERLGEVDLDRGPAVAMNGDRRFVDQDHQLVKNAFQNEHNALARPRARDLHAAPIASGPLRVAQRRKLGLPDPGRADRMTLAVEPRRWPFEFEVPEAVER